MLEGVIASSHSKQAMKDTFMTMLSGFIPTDSTGDGLFWTVDDEPVLGPIGFDEATARAGITTLIEAPGEMVRPEGDMVRLSESGDLLITIPASEQRPEARAFIRFQGFQPPTRVIIAIHGFLRNFAALWPRATD